MLASLAVVQSLTNAANASEAAEHIYEFAARDDGTDKVPRFILDVDGLTERWSASRFGGTIPVIVHLELEIPKVNAFTHQAQALWFWGKLETLLDEWEAAVNVGGGLVNLARSMSLPPGPVESEDLPESFGTNPVWICQLLCEVST